MNDYFKRLDLPVAAVATAVGGPLAVIRISGKNLATFLKELHINKDEERSVNYRNIFDVDHGLVLFFRSPKSFTGEDVVELQVHGSDRICEQIIQKLKSRNIIEALPGEFVFRAFTNGKMTLSQAEALHVGLTESDSALVTTELLNLSSAAQAETTNQFLDLEKKLTFARGRLESGIDFSEAVEEQKEDVISVTETLENLAVQLDSFLTSYENFSSSFSTPKVLIVGEPNAGKSSLLNLLLGSERSLVSDIAGTTRDYIEAKVKLKNQNFIFIDTAGIRELEIGVDKQNFDVLEKRGIQRALGLMNDAHAILWVASSSCEPNRNLERLIGSHKKPVVKVESFGDVSKKEGALNLVTDSRQLRTLLQNQLLPALSKRQEKHLEFFLSSRQVSLLKAVEESIKNSLENLKHDRPLEIVAEDLKMADQALKKCVGQNLSNDYISEIFSQFCLGK